MNPAVTTWPVTSRSHRESLAVRPGPDGCDPAACYGYVTHRVQTRFGIDHPAATQNQVPPAADASTAPVCSAAC